MKLKTETGEMLGLDEETQVWKGEGEDSDTSITVSEADEQDGCETIRNTH